MPGRTGPQGFWQKNVGFSVLINIFEVVTSAQFWYWGTDYGSKQICKPAHGVPYISNWEEFNKGKEGAIVLGPLPGAESISVVQLRLCGDRRPPQPKVPLWGFAPQLGPVTVYDFSTDFETRRTALRKMEMNLVKLKDERLSIMPNYSDEDIIKINKIIYLRNKEQLFYPETEELESLQNEIRGKYGVKAGALVFQGGKKIGVYVGTNQFVSMKEIWEGLALLLKQ